VGVRPDGKVLFAISQGEASFDAFARLFRDPLKCPNALFLDGGSAANFYAPTLNRLGKSYRLAQCWRYSRDIETQVGSNHQKQPQTGWVALTDAKARDA